MCISKIARGIISYPYALHICYHIPDYTRRHLSLILAFSICIQHPVLTQRAQLWSPQDRLSTLGQCHKVRAAVPDHPEHSTTGGGGRDLVLHTSAQPPTCSYTDPQQPGGHKGSGSFPEPRALPTPNLQPNLQTQTSRSRALHVIKWCCLKHKNKASCRSSFSYLSRGKQGSYTSCSGIPSTLLRAV